MTDAPLDPSSRDQVESPDMDAEGSRTQEAVCVGHAIVDILAPTPDATVARFGLTKGTMTLFDDADAARIYASLGPATEVSGGSAANTAVGLAALGSRTAFVGKVRDDDLGRVFIRDIRAAGVGYDVPAAATGPGTGRCLIMVTPDAEKTMCSSLGIGGRLAPEDVDVTLVAGARIVYIEGYLCGPETTTPTVERVVAAAESAGTLVALSLADPIWVTLHQATLTALLERVDILFANADEACGLVGTDDVEEAALALGERCHIVAVTRGAAGSLVVTNGRLLSVSAEPVAAVVDTTGAGDMYAAGFIHGLLEGRGPEDSARIAGIVAAEVVTHIGARPLTSLSDLVGSAGLS